MWLWGGATGVERLNRTNTLFAIDFWQPAVDSYNYNLGNKAFCMDIHNLDENKINELVNGQKCDILLGSPPCQGFSLQARYKYKNSEGEINEGMEQKNHLFLEFLRVANILQPKVIVMENVKGILTMKNKEGELILNNIIQAYNDIGYYVKYKIVECDKLGLPQTRHRVIFIASKDKDLLDKIHYPRYNNNKITIKDAIMDIPEKGDNYTLPLAYTSEYIQFLRKNENILVDNITNNTTKVVTERIKLIKTNECMRDLPNGHPLKTKSRFTNCYKREHENNSIGTISNIAKTILIHPNFDRIYTIRESLRLQNFPDSYILQGTPYDKYLMVANAIPPLLTENVVKNVIEVLDNLKGD